MSTLAPAGTRLTTADEAILNAQGKRTVIVVPPRNANNILLPNGQGQIVRPDSLPQIHILNEGQTQADIFAPSSTTEGKGEEKATTGLPFDLGALLQQAADAFFPKAQKAE